MSDVEMIELIKELQGMTPAAPYPCLTEKEIATIIRINEIWHMLANKVRNAWDENYKTFGPEILPAYHKVLIAWGKFVRAQKRLAGKRENLLEYNLILGNISIAAFHKNSMVDLGTLSYPKE